MSEDNKTRAAAQGIKFSQFKKVGPQEGNPVEVVGLRDGENVRADLTTDLVNTNPEITFRNAKGQFAAVDPGLLALDNQLKVNRYLYDRIQELNAKEGGTLKKDFVPQLRGAFEIDADGNAIAPDNAFYVSDEENSLGYENEIRYPGVWWHGGSTRAYRPKDITHLLISGSRYVEGVNDDDEYIYDVLEFAPNFFPSDIIRVTASEQEIYHGDADEIGGWLAENQHYGQRADDVWRVTKVLNVTHPTMSTKYFRAYELEKVRPKDQYSGTWYVNEDQTEDDYFDSNFNPVWVTNHYIEKEVPQFLQYKKVIPYASWTRGQWQLIDSRGYAVVTPKDAVLLKLTHADYLGTVVDVDAWNAGDTISFYSDDGQTEVASFHATNVEEGSDNQGKFLKITLDASETTGDDDLDPQIYYNIPNPLYGSGPEYATLEHSDNRDNLLQAEIEELALIVGDALQASQQEHGAWSYAGDGLQAYPREEGTFTLGSNNLGGAIENNAVFNTTDLDGQVHGFGDIEVGEYLEIVDEEHPEQYALWVVDAEPAVNGTLVDIKVKLKKAGKDGFDLNDRCQVRFIQIQESNLDLAELDKRYAGKEAERLNISHQAENTAWYDAPHKLGIVAANIQTEVWTGSYERLKRDGQKGLLAFTTKSPSSSGAIVWKSWTQLTEGSEYHLRNTDSRLDNTALKQFVTEDVGSVIVMKQPSTGAELSLHVKNTHSKISDDVTEHAPLVRIRRRRGSPTEDGEWRVYLQKEYLSAKGHDHYIGRLNTREDRVLKKWKSLSSGEFSLSEATGTPASGDGCYSWNRGRWFKLYSGQFSNSVISGDYNNGLGIATVQKGNTIYCGYLTVSEPYNYNGDHSWRTQSFMGQYETSPISEWDQTFIVSTNGLIQNTKTQYKELSATNIYALGSPDEDIENPERPVWTGDNFGDFKSLDDFVAELKSADPTGSRIEFLMEQWQTYWYTPGR